MDFEWRLLIKNLNYGIIDPPAPSSAKTSLYRYKAEASAKERDPPELLLLSSIIAGKKRIFSRQIFTFIFSVLRGRWQSCEELDWGILLAEQSLYSKRYCFLMFISSWRDQFTFSFPNSVKFFWFGLRPPCLCPFGWAPPWLLHTQVSESE